MKKIGLLGGTFDPPHIGHMIIADDCFHALELDEVWFIPSQIPPHKNKANVSSDKRLDMVTRATCHHPHFKVKDFELTRQGRSYTIDTMTMINAAYPDCIFYFIIGADMVEYLPHWQAIDELVEVVQFVGVKRPGYTLETPYPVKFVDSLEMDVSSSIIRERMKTNRPCKYLMLPAVYQYIKEHKLYE